MWDPLPIFLPSLPPSSSSSIGRCGQKDGGDPKVRSVPILASLTRSPCAPPSLIGPLVRWTMAYPRLALLTLTLRGIYWNCLYMGLSSVHASERPFLMWSRFIQASPWYHSCFKFKPFFCRTAVFNISHWSACIELIGLKWNQSQSAAQIGKTFGGLQ